MANHTKPRQKTKKSKILWVAFVAFFIYVVVSFTVMQVNIAHRKEELSQAQEQYKEQVYLNEELTNFLDSGENSDYIMKIAREKLGFAFPNERVIIDYKRK